MSTQCGCLLAIFGFFRTLMPAQREVTHPYLGRKFLLTKAEYAFYNLLVRELAHDYWIFTKVRMSDLLVVKNSCLERQAAFNRIKAKHIDFVICDPQQSKPLLAIELDDASHDQPSARHRDQFKDAAMAAAGLPLLRIRAKYRYDSRKIAGLIEEHLNPQPSR